MNDTLAMLEPIMRKLKILPQGLLMSDNNDWFFQAPERLPVHLPLSYALAIMQDAAEAWLLKLGWSFMKPGDSTEVNWTDPKGNEMCPHGRCFDSLLAALEYAEKALDITD